MYAPFSHLLTQPSPTSLRDRYLLVRGHSAELAAPLSAEDQCIQSMPDASPTKWHLAHTSWFFETLVLQGELPGYEVFDVRFSHLFNSYYEAIGTRHPRAQRGLITRPALSEVMAYRAYVDQAMLRLLATAQEHDLARLEPTILLGLNHEQQHQELLTTDILHAFSCNPLLPACGVPINGLSAGDITAANIPKWIHLPGGMVEIGHTRKTNDGFYFDNETPRHTALLQPYQLASTLVTCGEFAQFMSDGGYERPGLWLSDGWAMCKTLGWCTPAYWYRSEDLPPGLKNTSAQWFVFGLNGLQPMNIHAPVAQLSFYEAAAYAEWAGARLPTEFEWEAAAGADQLLQMTGSLWQWTRSSYDPYPGFKPLPGLAAEYNGKFMVGQLVLRGGSIATPKDHTRPTYRNFFPPAARWQFSGLRLAKDAV